MPWMVVPIRPAPSHALDSAKDHMPCHRTRGNPVSNSRLRTKSKYIQAGQIFHGYVPSECNRLVPSL